MSGASSSPGATARCASTVGPGIPPTTSWISTCILPAPAAVPQPIARNTPSSVPPVSTVTVCASFCSEEPPMPKLPAPKSTE